MRLMHLRLEGSAMQPGHIYLQVVDEMMPSYLMLSFNTPQGGERTDSQSNVSVGY